MKKNILQYLLFFAFNFAISQTVENVHYIIDYTHSVTPEGPAQLVQLNASLTANSKNSIYELYYTNKSDFIEEEDVSEEGSKVRSTIIRVPVKKNPIIFKDFRKKSIYSTSRILLKSFLIKDSINIFNWTIKKNEGKSILGYNCQKATVNFRGRSYIAYFTTDIPISIGPWKFTGLPGAILEIKEENNVLNITANKIVLKQEKITIENPYIKDKTISWSEFIETYKKKFEEINNYVGEGGTTLSIPKKGIEVYIDN